MEQIIRHFTDDDLYKFTMCCAVIDNFPRAQVKYTFNDRDDTVYPEGFATELEKQIVALEDVVITDEDNLLLYLCQIVKPFIKKQQFYKEQTRYNK